MLKRCFLACVFMTISALAHAQGWTCYTQAGGPCLDRGFLPVGPQVHVTVPTPGHGRTRAEASADAMKACLAGQWLCCRVTHCTGKDKQNACTVCDQKLMSGIGNAARSSAMSKQHAIAAIDAYQRCIAKNGCPSTNNSLLNQAKSCLGMDDAGAGQCLKYAVEHH